MGLIIDLLFPKFCYGCGKVGFYLCRNCRIRKLGLRHAHRCHITGVELRTGFVTEEGREQTGLDGVVVCCDYTEVAAKLITQAKYKFYHQVLREMAEVMSLRAGELGVPVGSMFTFVPAHRSKRWWRGFDQAELLARYTAERSAFRMQRLLRRRRATRTQVGKSREQRLQSLGGVFEFVGDEIPERVIIIDDVYTTGSTLEHCAEVLRARGVKEVYGYVFASERWMQGDL